MDQTAANPIINFLPIIVIFLIFYVLLIRPQKQKQQEHKAMLSQIKKNDEVITAGGIHGTIANVKDRSAIVRVDDNVKIEIEKDFITTVIKKA
ncbi:preprotein translocase subunit YajC [Candidatus Omnitrophota bacterium]